MRGFRFILWRQNTGDDIDIMSQVYLSSMSDKIVDYTHRYRDRVMNQVEINVISPQPLQ